MRRMLSMIFYGVSTISVAVNLHPPLQSPILKVFISGGIVMKKIYLFLAVFVLMSSFIVSEDIDLGKFPKGKWMDKNWNAIWEFGADNIRLLDTNGSEIFNFKDKISDFKIDIGVSEAKISFTSTEAERKYVFTKGVTDLDLVMNIDPDWTDENYRVTMEMQK